LQISIELDNDSCPVLIRSGADTDTDELLHRHKWMAALAGGPAAGPSKIADHTLTRPFVAGRPVHQLADHETEQALVSLVEFVAQMAERGCTHGSLEADKVIATTAGIHVLDAGSCRAQGTAEAQAIDVAALGQMIDELSPTDSYIRSAWMDLSSTTAPTNATAAALAQRICGTAVRPPTTLPPRWPRQVAMASVLAVAIIALALGSRSAGGSSEVPDEQRPADSLTAASPATASAATEPSTTTQPAPPQALWTEEPCELPSCGTELSWADGVLTVAGAQYALGKPGDEVFFGRWYCDTEPTPAVFTAAGSLYLFSAMDLPAVQTVVGQVASMTVEADVECDSLLATSAAGTATRFPTLTEPIQP
jgi:stage V sporulation protein SpoVS